MAFLRAMLRPGAQIVLEAVKLEEQLRSADLVITAEGQLDAQTAYGKSVGAVAALAKRYRLPVLALAGSLGEDYRTIYTLGIDAIAVLPSGPMTLSYAMEHAAQLISDAARGKRYAPTISTNPLYSCLTFAYLPRLYGKYW